MEVVVVSAETASENVVSTKVVGVSVMVAGEVVIACDVPEVTRSVEIAVVLVISAVIWGIAELELPVSTMETVVCVMLTELVEAGDSVAFSVAVVVVVVRLAELVATVEVSDINAIVMGQLVVVVSAEVPVLSDVVDSMETVVVWVSVVVPGAVVLVGPAEVSASDTVVVSVAVLVI